MARIQVYVNQVERQGITTARLVAPDFGPSGIGQGLQMAGRALANFAEEQQQLGEIHDQATVKEAANGVGSYFAELGYTGDNPYFSKKGKDALVERPEIERSLDTYIQNAERGLKTEKQREMFRNAVTAQRTAWGVQIARHADTETKSYDADQSAARLGISGELAKSTYLADPEHGEKQIDTGLGEIDNLAQLQGWSPERRQFEKLKFTSDTYRDIAVSIITADPVNGPAVVEKLVEAKGGAMTADDREFVMNNTQTQVRMNEAEARRQEAEQRRLQREAQSEAKDRARSAAENLDLGIPMNAADYSKAVEDAKASGDENLLKRVQAGQFKNLLSQQYAGATPNELQTRVNELTAQIQRDGSKAKPEMVIERDHLTTLLGKANAAMGQDSLSYGAANAGIKLGPLDLNDPASVRQRADIARKVGKRMGGVVRVMTNEEAATFAPMVVNGSVKEKAMLAVRLARFGDLKDEAARQIAPNDTGFHNLVGLASHPSPNVGFSRVTEVLAGKEMLDKSPQLIDEKATSLGARRGSLHFATSIDTRQTTSSRTQDRFRDFLLAFFPS